MPNRYRLCTTNERDALVDELAAEMWASRRDNEMDLPWDQASPYWHRGNASVRGGDALDAPARA